MANRSLMLGGEVDMWGEGIDDTNFEPFVFPKTSAAAEPMWSSIVRPPAAEVRLASHRCKVVAAGVRASPIGPGPPCGAILKTDDGITSPRDLDGMLPMGATAVALASSTTVITTGASAAPAVPTAPTTLLAEYSASPAIGVDSPKPRFSWTLASATRGVSSAAYQIVVTTTDTKGDTDTAWDSKKVVSDASNQVPCGVALVANTRYEWKVRWWPSGGGEPSMYSAPALLHSGLFSTADWRGAIPIDSAATEEELSTATSAVDSNPCAKVAVDGSGCKMINTKTIKPNEPAGYFSSSAFNETQAHGVNSIPDCISACEMDVACVQITWAPTHGDKCVMYQSIGPAFAAGAEGWVKLSGRFIVPAGSAAACPVKGGYPAGCAWFESYVDGGKHFVSDCDAYPLACGKAQKSCWYFSTIFQSGLVETHNLMSLSISPTCLNFSRLIEYFGCF